jgi:trk system potassium uptake protein TrkH
MLLMIFSLTLLPPMLVASIYGETTHQAFFLSFAITFSIGMAMWLPFRRNNAD